MTAYNKKKKKFSKILTSRPQFSLEAFERLWRNNLTIQELAEFFQVSDETIRLAAKKLSLLAKREIKKDLVQEWQPGDPTPEEIKARAAVVRQKWSDTEHLRRMGFIPAQPVEVHRYVYHARNSSFSAAN